MACYSRFRQIDIREKISRMYDKWPETSLPSSRLPRRRARLRRWFRSHDDRVSFTILYITLALVLSMTISLFWLVAVVAAHAAIEYWALGRQRVADHRLGLTLWHIKLDVVLVLAALWLGLYIDLLFGVAGLGAAARTGAQAGGRIIAWQRAIRGVLMSVDEAALAARAVIGKGGRVTEQPGHMPPPTPPWLRQWSPGDRLTVGLGAMLALLIMLAPVLTDHSVIETMRILGADLHPWPQ